MKIGIEKMKLAHKKKVAIKVSPVSMGMCGLWCVYHSHCTGSLLKVFNVDRSNKTVVVEEGMTSSMVCHLLVVKNHFDESPNWVLVEQLGDISLGEWVWSENIS